MTTRPPSALSPKQLRVCELAARGMADKQIAHEMRVGFSGVRRHWDGVFLKLKCHHRTVAGLLAKLQTDGRHGGNPATGNTATMRKQPRSPKVKP